MADFNDAPISDPNQDLFGFDPFAKAIARCILALDGHVGSVVAIHGPWGSGKSSVINLVRHHLKQEEDPPVVVPIQAWWYRTEDALAIGFFQELYAALQRELPQVAGNKAKNALATLGGHVVGAGPLMGAALGLFAGSAAEGAVNAVSATLSNYIRTDENTEQLQKNVADVLLAQKKRFLFVVDDLDRLTPDEALVVLRLIKSVGRLPNVAYLLSYDREVTERVVAERYPSEGAHYLEKIVQAGFELPEPDPFKLRAMFADQLQKMFENVDEAELIGVSEKEFLNLLHEAVFPELRTPRDVVRLINSVEITWSTVRGDVHMGDFLALEALRLFRPATYRAVRASKGKLTGVESGQHNVHVAAEELEARLIGSETEERARLKKVLMRLFPQIQAIWSNTHHSDDKSWRKERRVCTNEHFETYFTYSLPDYTVSRAEIDDLLSSSGDRIAVKAAFKAALSVKTAAGQTRASYLLEELSVHADRVLDTNIEPLLSALFEMADELMIEADEPKGFAFVDNSNRLNWVLSGLTRQRMTLAERSALLLRLAPAASMTWLAYIVQSAHEYHRLKEGDDASSDDRLLTTADDQGLLEAIFIDRVHAAAADGSLLKSANLASSLHIWANLDPKGDPVVNAWTQKVLDDDVAVATLARAFLGNTWTQSAGYDGLGDHVARRRDRVGLESVGKLVNLVLFKSRLEEVADVCKLTGEQRDVVKRLLIAWGNDEDNMLS